MRLRKRYCFMTVLAFMFFNDLRLPGCAPGAAFSCASGAAFSPCSRFVALACEPGLPVALAQSLGGVVGECGSGCERVVLEPSVKSH